MGDFMDEAVETAQSYAADSMLYDAGRDAAQYAVDTGAQYTPAATHAAAEHGTHAESPGFGLAVAGLALIGAGLLAARRSTDSDDTDDRYDTDDGSGAYTAEDAAQESLLSGGERVSKGRQRD